MNQQTSSTGYRGKITSASSQKVQAPISQTQGKAPQVQKGTDLRSGK